MNTDNICTQVTGDRGSKTEQNTHGMKGYQSETRRNRNVDKKLKQPEMGQDRSRQRNTRKQKIHNLTTNIVKELN